MKYYFCNVQCRKASFLASSIWINRLSVISIPMKERKKLNHFKWGEGVVGQLDFVELQNKSYSAIFITNPGHYDKRCGMAQDFSGGGVAFPD